MELGFSWKIFPDGVEKVFSDVCGYFFIKRWVVKNDFSLSFLVLVVVDWLSWVVVESTIVS